MDNQGSKFFDVTKPSPSATSRPVIVGHRPVMVDPMVRRPQATPPPTAGPVNHMAKNLTPSPATVATTMPMQQPAAPALSAQPVSVSASVPPAPTPAPEAVAVAAAPTDPASPPTPQMDASAVTMQPAPVAVAPAAAFAPAQTTELHLQSLPVSHEPMNGPRRMRMLVSWLLVLLVLAAVGAYLAIDAGLINTGINLPFHIFHQA